MHLEAMRFALWKESIAFLEAGDVAGGASEAQTRGAGASWDNERLESRRRPG